MNEPRDQEVILITTVPYTAHSPTHASVAVSYQHMNRKHLNVLRYYLSPTKIEVNVYVPF
jgi:hypothetical protein